MRKKQKGSKANSTLQQEVKILVQDQEGLLHAQVLHQSEAAANHIASYGHSRLRRR